MTVPSTAAPDPAATPRTSFWRRGSSDGAVAKGIVVALTLLCFLQSLRAPFLYDDTTIIRDNAWLRGWPALLHVWTQPYWPTSGPDALGLYRPVHIALLAVVWNVSRGSPLAFHVYALALAIGCALAVLWLLRRATTPGAALAGALVFAVHPLHVEAIASVANSSELIVALCTIGIVRVLVSPRADDRRHTVALVVLTVAALLAKESGLLALPLALIAAWGWRPHGERVELRSLVRRHRYALIAASAGIIVALIARRAVLGAAVSRSSIAAQGLELTPPERIATMMSLWPRILESLAWPSLLSPYYGPTLVPVHRAPYVVAGLALVLLALVLAVLAARRGDRRPLVALAWIAFTYFPASNLLVATGQLLADRTLFGATIGLALAVAWSVDAIPGRWRGAALAAVSMLVIHGAVISMRYSLAWTSHRALWQHLVFVAPREHLGYKLLGMDARARGNQAEAIALLSRARAMAPSDRQIQFELGQALYEAKRFDQAAEVLATLLRDEDVRGEAGFVRLYLDAVGRARGAQAVVDAARPLLTTPAAATAALYSGIALERLGRPAAADSAFTAGLAAAPGDTALAARVRKR